MRGRSGPPSAPRTRTRLRTAVRFDEDPDERRSREQAEALARQSPRHQELLVEMEKRTEPKDDDETDAWNLSAAFVVSGAVAYHVEWLRAETRAMLDCHRPQLAAIAAALHKHHVLNAAEVDAALVGTRCICHRWL